MSSRREVRDPKRTPYRRASKSAKERRRSFWRWRFIHSVTFRAGLQIHRMQGGVPGRDARTTIADLYHTDRPFPPAGEWADVVLGRSDPIALAWQCLSTRQGDRRSWTGAGSVAYSDAAVATRAASPCGGALMACSFRGAMWRCERVNVWSGGGRGALKASRRTATAARRIAGVAEGEG